MAEQLRILTLNSISHAGLKLLPAERYEVGSHVERPDAILVRSQDMHAMTIAGTRCARSAVPAPAPTTSRCRR